VTLQAPLAFLALSYLLRSWLSFFRLSTDNCCY
jgi:hypothetical protein